jgi:hypothetical protein
VALLIIVNQSAILLSIAKSIRKKVDDAGIGLVHSIRGHTFTPFRGITITRTLTALVFQVCSVIRMSSVSPFGELFRNSPCLLSEKFTESDASTNCADYMDSQSSYMQEKNEDCKPSQKRKQAPVHEEQSDSTDENDDSDSTVPSVCGKKCRGKVIKVKDDQLDLQCEWQDCDYHTCNLDGFVRHVSLHIPHLEVKVNENQEGTGSGLFPRILPTSSSTWQCNLSNSLLVHINSCSFFKYLKRLY